MANRPWSVAVTADLHWGIRPHADEATRLLADFLRADPPDLLLLAGDLGADEHFGPGLDVFADLPCRKALVPGNHDIWVREEDARGDSLTVYREHLPRLCAERGFHYLDAGPLVLDDRLAVVGSINWYDYSWAIDELRRRFPGEEERLQTKRFTRGRHNDGRFVRWPLDDGRFTREVAGELARHLHQARAAAEQVIVVTHHPPFRGLSFPRLLPLVTLDGLLWEAFTGNVHVERLLADHSSHVPYVFCGHTHKPREGQLRSTRGLNVGSDYDVKRLLLLTWPDGTIETHTFEG
jgi:predicted phosphohydrolase